MGILNKINQELRNRRERRDLLRRNREERNQLLNRINSGDFGDGQTTIGWVENNLEVLRVLLGKGDFQSPAQLEQLAGKAKNIWRKNQLETLKLLLDKGDFQCNDELEKLVDIAQKIKMEPQQKALKILFDNFDFKSIEELRQAVMSVEVMSGDNDRFKALKSTVENVSIEKCSPEFIMKISYFIGCLPDDNFQSYVANIEPKIQEYKKNYPHIIHVVSKNGFPVEKQFLKDNLMGFLYPGGNVILEAMKDAAGTSRCINFIPPKVNTPSKQRRITTG